MIWQPTVKGVDEGSMNNDVLFVMGGFGGWPEDNPKYDGMRCRNDVYSTKDGGKGH